MVLSLHRFVPPLQWLVLDGHVFLASLDMSGIFLWLLTAGELRGWRVWLMAALFPFRASPHCIGGHSIFLLYLQEPFAFFCFFRLRWVVVSSCVRFTDPFFLLPCF